MASKPHGLFVSITRNRQYHSNHTAGCNPDFDAIGQDWANFTKTFPAFMRQYGIDGFDIDLEVEVSFPIVTGKLAGLTSTMAFYI